MNAQNLIDTPNSLPSEVSKTSQLPAAYYNATTAPVRETTDGVEDSEIPIDMHNIQIPFTGSFGSSATAGSNQIYGFGENLIYTSGPFLNSSNLSIVEGEDEGMNSFGFASHRSDDYSVAEEFALSMDFDITSIVVYAYQTGSQAPSITEAYVQVWDGDPSSGNASVVWGDLTTNILEDAEATGAYRVLDIEQSLTSREIQKVTVNTSGLSLTTGSYWVEYSLEGSGSSGPWVPPVVVEGETITGDALQNVNGTWQAIVDTGTSDPQGLPIQIYGIADIGNNNCVEINPPYDWYFEQAYGITAGSRFKVANDLTLDAGESFTLQNITAILGSEWPVENIDVIYYEDDNGFPGAVIGSENSVTIDENNAIGAAYATTNIYEVKLTVDPFDFIGQENSPTSYWIQLSATNSHDVPIYWVGTSDNVIGNPQAQEEDTDGWEYNDPSFDGLYIWSGECSPLLGVEENELTQFRVYPNPTNDVLYLEAGNSIESISLFNLLGQEVLTGKNR